MPAEHTHPVTLWSTESIFPNLRSKRGKKKGRKRGIGRERVPRTVNITLLKKYESVLGKRCKWCCIEEQQATVLKNTTSAIFPA